MYSQLEDNEAFRALFEDERSDLCREIRRLEQACQNVNITDPVQQMQIKATLAGIRLVREKVARMAKMEREPMAAAPAPPDPGFWRRAPRRLFPARLGG